MNEQTDQKLDRLPNLLPWVIVFAAAALVGAYLWAFNQLPTRESPPAWGAFGDYLGGLLNPLVSTFTLIVAVKVWQQQKEEMQKTKNALAEQSQTAGQQRFFDLMHIYQQTLVGYQGADGKSGKQAIQDWLYSDEGMGITQGLHDFQKRRGNQCPRPERLAADITNWSDELGQRWKRPETALHLSHYYRVVFHVLSNAKTILGEDRYRYVRLFRAQLSQAELILLTLNLRFNSEGSRVKKLVGEYGLLKYLPKGDLRKEAELLLPPAVFGRTFQTSQVESQK